MPGLTREQYATKGKVLAYFPLIGAVALWVLYGVRAIFGVDLAQRWSRSEPAPTILYLVLAVLGSVVAGVWTAWNLKVRGRLLTHGKMVAGKVVAVAGYSSSGQQPVTFTYVVGGKEITLKKDLLKGYKVDDVVGVLYDPEKPERCEVLAAEDKGDGVQG